MKKTNWKGVLLVIAVAMFALGSVGCGSAPVPQAPEVPTSDQPAAPEAPAEDEGKKEDSEHPADHPKDAEHPSDHPK